MSCDTRTFIEQCTPYIHCDKEAGGGSYFFAMGVAGSEDYFAVRDLTRTQADQFSNFVRAVTRQTAENVQHRTQQALGIKP